MKKRVLIITFIALFLVTSVLAAHESQVSLFSGSLEVYETNTQEQIIEIDNLNCGSDDINKTEIEVNGFDILSAEGWGWNPIINGNKITWTGSNIYCSSPGKEYFKVTVKANQVQSNSSFNWTITTTDISNEKNTTKLEFQILKDVFSPTLSNPFPENNTIIKNITSIFSSVK